MAFRPKDFKADALSGNGSHPDVRKDNPISRIGADRYRRADNQSDTRGNGFRVVRGSPAASYSVLVRSWPMSATRHRGWPESTPPQSLPRTVATLPLIKTTHSFGPPAAGRGTRGTATRYRFRRRTASLPGDTAGLRYRRGQGRQGRARRGTRPSGLRERSKFVQQRSRRLRAHRHIFGKQLHDQCRDVARNVRTQLVGWCTRSAQNF